MYAYNNSVIYNEDGDDFGGDDEAEDSDADGGSEEM